VLTLSQHKSTSSPDWPDLKIDRGSACTPASTIADSDTQIAINQSVTFLFYLVVPGYFTQGGTPDDPSALDGYMVEASLTKNGVGYFTGTLDGPGAYENLFTLTGASALANLSTTP
jgi:hypothetical protein